MSLEAQTFERVEAFDSKKERDVAFQGRKIAVSYTTDQVAYLTPRDAIVIIDGADDTVNIFDGWDELTAMPFLDRWPAEDLMKDIAAELGVKYVEELDI